ncbi:MAG: Hint domain-containing protein [Candidatus Eisenbacteria bacterium]|uniref:Hint domain-containing protein n=1 Tax=Eiseniibacteriota bacterium TaxID=2212470 RepID=A0A956LW31_UNCEI|nr:Hint domain-containing protein [Candidatus Eisenbacteria bacterium]
MVARSSQVYPVLALFFMAAFIALPQRASSQGLCVFCQLDDPGPPARWSCTVAQASGYQFCQTNSYTCVASGSCTSGGCLLAGTQVATPSGNVSIEDLVVGDEVLVSSLGGTATTGMVRRTYCTLASGYYLINGELGTTSSHPFRVGGKWVPAEALRTGQQVVGRAGVTTIESIEWVPRGARVYNIEVDEAHTFYVDGLLVHNKTLPLNPGNP